jgi:catechol 2,3-dioxygenase-like lactoylglutathione lyase family enzyme
MSRVQLALNVSDLDKAIDFYSRYFDATPAKVRPGYANFALDEPPLKLVLIEGTGAPGSINHLGVEVFTSEEVAAKATALTARGFPIDVEEQTTCCYAVQDKVWVDGPDGTSWETYVVLGDADGAMGADGATQCCAATPDAATRCC